MIQRKQTLYLLAAIVMTVICLCMQIGSFKAAGLEVARVFNLWYTDPLGKHHFDTWPLMAVLLPTAVLLSLQRLAYRGLVRMLFRGWTDRWRQVVGHGILPSYMASRSAGHRPHPLPDGPSRYQCRRETRPVYG